MLGITVMRASDFQKNFCECIKRTVEENIIIEVSVNTGTAVIISEEKYRSAMETLLLNTMPGMVQELVGGLNTSIKACITENEV